MTITKEKFIELVGEDPVDVLGNDWANTVDDYLDNLSNEQFKI